jgi:hypothetical protein
MRIDEVVEENAAKEEDRVVEDKREHPSDCKDDPGGVENQLQVTPPLVCGAKIEALFHSPFFFVR